MDPQHGIPFVAGGVDEHPVPHDAGVVDDHVEPAERVDGRLHDPAGPLPVGYVVAVDHGPAPERPDLLGHLFSRIRGGADPIEAGSDVVDHHRGALPGELQGVGPADAPAGARHHHDPSLADHGWTPPASSARWRSTSFMTLPAPLTGSSATTSTPRGTL